MTPVVRVEIPDGLAIGSIFWRCFDFGLTGIVRLALALTTLGVGLRFSDSGRGDGETG